jgi:hypothetical protein
MISGAMKETSKSIFKALMIVFVLVLVASYVLAMLLGVQLFLFTSEGRSLSMDTRPLPIFLFLLFQVETPSALNLGLIFLFVWSVYLLCLLAAWIWRQSFHSVIGNAFARPVRRIFSNFLFVLPILASMLYLAVIGLHYFQESALGVPTGEPSLPENPFETFFLLAYSPLIEEIGFRLSPIGLFLIVYVFWAGRRIVTQFSTKQLLRLFLVAPVYPEDAKRMICLKNIGADGFGGISMSEWAMLFATSLFFGVAHLLSGIGWDVGKVTSTFMVGFIFGLAYLAYGFQAPILLHWFFNYYFYTYELASDMYPTTFSIEILILFLTIIIAIFGSIALLAIGLSKISSRKKVNEKEEPSNPLL